jgi:general secretion pathway protein L
MSETLVIRLRAAEDAPASWLIVDSNGARSGPVHTGPLTEATALAQDRRVVLLLPGAEVGLAEPELPLRGGAKLAQAVPFALEEQLASDVEALHFAVGERDGGTVGTPVGTVARGLMDRWHAACEAAGIRPSSAYADTIAVPVSPNGCTLLVDEGSLYVRRADGVPYVLDAEPLDAALELAMASSTAAATHVTLYATPEEYERNRDLIEGLRRDTQTLQVKLMPEGPLPLLAAQAANMHGVNLLQGNYAVKTTGPVALRAWRLPAALAAATVLVILLNQAASLWQLARAEKRLDSEITEIFQSVMPGQPIVDPRAQMEGVLGHGGAQGTLLPALSQLARAMSESPGGRIEAMSYRAGALDLRVVAPTVEALDGIKQAMSRQGAQVDLQSATPRGDVVEGRLQVRLGAA